MDKRDLELFKQAISEGLSEKLDSVVNNCTEKIVCSDRHELAMRTIVYGKADTKRTWSPRARRLIAILIAAALLLTSCAVIFRNEIREIINEFFVQLTYPNAEEGETIEEVYELSYLPEGYYLNVENIRPMRVQYEFTNESGDCICFEQKLKDGTSFVFDSERGYSQISEIQDYAVYYRNVNAKHVYVWDNGKYAVSLTSNVELSNEEIVSILCGIVIK